MEQNEQEQLKQQEYQQALKRREKKDFRQSWVSSSPFIFYLSVACLVFYTLGGCYMLYTKRFEKPKVQVQSSTLYTPVYK